MAWGDGRMHGNLGAFQVLKAQHPHLHVAISLGGWTKSQHFSGCAADAPSRSKLVATAVALVQSTGFDGIDVDWE